MIGDSGCWGAEEGGGGADTVRDRPAGDWLLGERRQGRMSPSLLLVLAGALYSPQVTLRGESDRSANSYRWSKEPLHGETAGRRGDARAASGQDWSDPLLRDGQGSEEGGGRKEGQMAGGDERHNVRMENVVEPMDYYDRQSVRSRPAGPPQSRERTQTAPQKVERRMGHPGKCWSEQVGDYFTSYCI